MKKTHRENTSLLLRQAMLAVLMLLTFSVFWGGISARRVYAAEKTLRGPAGVYATRLNGGSISVTWLDIEGIHRYRVYQKEKSAKEYTLVKTAKEGPVLLKKGILPGKSYTFYVTGVDKSGKEGRPSKKVTVQYLPPVTGVVFRILSDNRTRVSWNKVPRALSYELAVTHTNNTDAIDPDRTLSTNKTSLEIAVNNRETNYYYIRARIKKDSCEVSGDWVLAKASSKNPSDPGQEDDSIKNVPVEFSVSGGESTARLNGTYSDSWFLASSKKEQSSLAFLSALGAATTYRDKTGKNHAKAMLKSCGFDVPEGFLFSADGTAKGRSTVKDYDHARLQYGYKTLQKNGQKVLLVAVIVGGYTGSQSEWISNFNLGSGATVTGFGNAALEACSLTLQKIREYRANSKDTYSEVRFWIMGHSRGGAVANLMGQRLTETFGQSNVYVYGFAVPNVSRKVSAYANIHNYIMESDFFPRLAPSEWGYKRNGKDILLTSNATSKRCFYSMERTDYSELSKKETNRLVKLFLNLAGSRKEYTQNRAKTGDPIIPAVFFQRGLCYFLNTKDSIRTKGLTLIFDYISRDKACAKLFEVITSYLADSKVQNTHLITNYLAVLMSR